MSHSREASLRDAERRAGPPLIGALLRRPLDAVHARMMHDLAEAGFADVVLAHLAVLRYPGPDGRRPSDLALEANMSRQAMNYLLGELEQLGYLVRVDDPEDGRSKRVHTTERGDSVGLALRESVSRIEADLERELGVRAFGQLRRLLVKVNDSEIVRPTA